MHTAASPVSATISPDALRATARRRGQLKGRQPDDAARAQVRALIGPGPHRRDRLIELLHLLNDAHHGLHEAHLVALAFAVAVMLSLLSAKQSVRLVDTGIAQHVIYPGFALPVFALVLANLAVIRRSEATERAWQLRLGPMFAAVLGTVFTFWAVPGAGGPAAAAAFGGASLWFLDRRSEGVPAEMVRARADLLTFLALAAGLWIR